WKEEENTTKTRSHEGKPALNFSMPLCLGGYSSLLTLHTIGSGEISINGNGGKKRKIPQRHKDTK
ncbi:MAG: hypothetical protein WBM17_06595, partial [Anaerolineales bacterium]